MSTLRDRAALARDFGRITAVLSWAYKRAALGLLLALFGGFICFAFTVGFFLFSTDWGAPIILSRGHELVDRTERTLGELAVRNNDLRSEIAQLNIDRQRAQIEVDRAAASIETLALAIAAEAEARRLSLDGHRASLKDLRQNEAEFASVLAVLGGSAPGNEAYDQRLITRRQAASESLSLAETRYRLGIVRAEQRLMRERIAGSELALATLHDVHARLVEPQRGVVGIPGSGAELIAVVDRAIVVMADLTLARGALAAIDGRRGIALESIAVVEGGIRQLKSKPLGQAVERAVNVVFVPYTNLERFAPGTPLYSCHLWIVICRRVGAVRETVEGEATLTHPMFNRQVRGVFVDVALTEPAAAREILIHAGRPPLFL